MNDFLIALHQRIHKDQYTSTIVAVAVALGLIALYDRPQGVLILALLSPDLRPLLWDYAG